MGCLVLEDIEVELEAKEAELANDCCPKTTFEDALLRMTAVILGDLNLDLGCSKTPVRLLLSVAAEETLHPTK